MFLTFSLHDSAALKGGAGNCPARGPEDQRYQILTVIASIASIS